MWMKNDKDDFTSNVENLYWKIIGISVLCIMLCVLFIAAFFNMYQEKKEAIGNTAETEEYGPNFGTQNEQEENVPNFGTWISNLDEEAVPYLGEKSILLEEALLMTMPDIKSQSKQAEIFYVMVPEDDVDSICFFVNVPGETKSLVLTYSFVTEKVTASWNEYTTNVTYTIKGVLGAHP